MIVCVCVCVCVRATEKQVDKMDGRDLQSYVSQSEGGQPRMRRILSCSLTDDSAAPLTFEDRLHWSNLSNV